MFNICRVCTSSDFKDGISVYDFEGATMFSEMIMSICNVIISQEDGLPDFICPDCLDKLNISCRFKQKCENADKILRSNFTMFKTKHPEDIIQFDLDVKMENNDMQIDDSNELNSLDTEFPESDLMLSTSEIESLICNKYTKKRLKYKCEECSNSFRKKTELKLHMKSHVYICDICKRNFKIKASIEKHFRIDDKNCQYISKGYLLVDGIGKKRIFQCSKCDYKSIRLIDSKMHLVTHSSHKPFKCEMCSCAYTQRASLTHHIQLMHLPNTPNFTCEICGKVILTKKKLQKHLRSHSPNIITCSICKIMLKSKKSMSQHMRIHLGVKNFICDECNASFFTHSGLSNHKRRHFPKDILYHCTKCEYRATRRSLLKSHTAKHTNEKPFSCHNCGQLFTTKQHLESHMKRYDKKLQCPICENMFVGTKIIRDHIKYQHAIKGSVKGTRVIIQESIIDQKLDYSNMKKEEVITTMTGLDSF